MKSRYKAVIYDCDGVMFDSFDANFAFYAAVLGRFGRSLDRSDADTMRILHTYSNRDVLAYLFTAEEELAEAIRHAGTVDYRSLVPMMRMEEGFRETVASLHETMNLAVCTNRSTSMEMVLQTFSLTPFFSCVMTAAKVANPKPSPDPLFKVLEHYGIEPAEALFVGDSEVDRLAAEAAGVPFVAYKSSMPATPRIDHHGQIFNFLL